MNLYFLVYLKGKSLCRGGEMVDARDSKSRGGDTVSVQVRLPVPETFNKKVIMKNKEVNECIFCRILKKEIPADTIAETKNFIVVKDIAPKAPIHYLIIPTNHIRQISDITTENSSIIAEMICFINDLAKRKNITDFRLLINNGKKAGQEIFHLHIHMLAGYK